MFIVQMKSALFEGEFPLSMIWLQFRLFVR